MARHRITERDNDTDELVRVLDDHLSYEEIAESGPNYPTVDAGHHIRIERETPEGWEYL